jgi:hypothetical protein
VGIISSLKEKLREYRERRKEERKAAELTPEKTERLRAILPELRYFEKPTHSDVADALTLRLARKGVYLSDREAKRLALEVSRDPSAYNRILQRIEAEKVRQRARQVKEKAQRIRQRASERKAREMELRIARANAFIESFLGNPAPRRPRHRHSYRRRRR